MWRWQQTQQIKIQTQIKILKKWCATKNNRKRIRPYYVLLQAETSSLEPISELTESKFEKITASYFDKYFLLHDFLHNNDDDKNNNKNIEEEIIATCNTEEEDDN